jgi:hypothetical protein
MRFSSLFRIQCEINCIFTNSVRILCLSCNVNFFFKFKILLKRAKSCIVLFVYKMSSITSVLIPLMIVIVALHESGIRKDLLGPCLFDLSKLHNCRIKWFLHTVILWDIFLKVEVTLFTLYIKSTLHVYPSHVTTHMSGIL